MSSEAESTFAAQSEPSLGEIPQGLGKLQRFRSRMTSDALKAGLSVSLMVGGTGLGYATAKVLLSPPSFVTIGEQSYPKERFLPEPEPTISEEIVPVSDAVFIGTGTLDDQTMYANPLYTGQTLAGNLNKALAAHSGENPFDVVMAANDHLTPTPEANDIIGEQDTDRDLLTVEEAVNEHRIIPTAVKEGWSCSQEELQAFIHDENDKTQMYAYIDPANCISESTYAIPSLGNTDEITYFELYSQASHSAQMRNQYMTPYSPSVIPGWEENS